MLRKVQDQIKSSVPYQYVSKNAASLFAQTPAETKEIEYTRFNSSVEVRDVCDALTKLVDKQARLQKEAEEAGDYSNEAETLHVLTNIINAAQEKVDDFNSQEIKKDMMSNIKDMHGLMQSMIEIIQITDEDEQKLDSVQTDKPLFKNYGISAGLLSLSTLPLFLLGPGAAALILGFGGLVLAKPANDYLTSKKVINWDTESKQLYLNFIESVDKANTHLSDYIAKHEVSHDNNNNTSMRLK